MKQSVTQIQLDLSVTIEQGAPLLVTGPNGNCNTDDACLLFLFITAIQDVESRL
jgi:ABC-type transport system involved in cytochrome c biogenesis ATPase subunit